ncbi:MAG: DUF3488 and DUF4129 domain-containing transglutaminase family protein, partial [Leptolyngbyaceae cyanobacterium]
MTSQTPDQIESSSQTGGSSSAPLNAPDGSHDPLFSRFASWKELQTRITQGPSYKIEESWQLRIMVQLLVSVGIIATDIAAADVTSLLQVSYWAVPVSAVGAAWSWYRRHSRNVPVKFCIALAMILALGGFFARILVERNDTRLALAELLIQLQVFHSFDLPRRKDLGYSMVIGLILLGVAATVSQTLAFGPLLLLFVAIALPTIALDYRSRLGVLFKPQQKASQNLKPLGQSITRTLPLLGMALVLGLVIFAVMPRFQGYQLRMFPMSEQIEIQGEFDGRTILNPGYISGGQDLDGDGVGDAVSGDGQTFESGPGEINPESYYGFNSTMNQNLRGELTPKVVMRVRSQAEGFWRVLAFDQYTGQGWTISRQEEEDIEILKRPSWSLRFRLPWVPNLSRTREVIQTYTVTADLPNLIPAMYEASQLYFPTQEIAIDPDGSLRAPVNLVDGLTYTVVSKVPYRDRSRFQEASTDYTEDIQTHYLQLPENISEDIRAKTVEILEQAPNPLTSLYEQALYLGQYLKQNYAIQPDLPFLGPEEDLVESFLFKTTGGYPDHFSTVLTVMLRSVGIPARLITGFAPGEFNPFTGFYLVRNTDAYALTDVYLPPYGWFSIDPIPGRELVPPSIEDYETFSVLQRIWKWVAGWLPSPITGLVSGFFTLIMTTIGRIVGIVSGLLTGDWARVFIGLVTLTVVAFGVWLIRSVWKAIAFRFWLAKLHPMDAIYQQMLQWLAQQGFRKSAAQTPSEYAEAMRDRQPSPKAEMIETISDAYVNWRYGNHSADIEVLSQQLKDLKKTTL